MLSLTKGCIM